MAKIGFVGLGHMGLPMCLNLLGKGHQVTAFDLSAAAMKAAQDKGAKSAVVLSDILINTDIVISMLPEGKHVRSVYLGADGLLEKATKPIFIADCSTIDVLTAREVSEMAKQKNHRMVDAPVSGGVKGAENATLTFMVGGAVTYFDFIKTILADMGKNIFHTGDVGTGQAAKICNNLMLAIHMIGTAEGFALAKQYGLSDEKLFEVASVSSGQSWSMTSYCPVPGPVSTSPANRDYVPGFAASMMLKDLKLALAENSIDALGQKALELYQNFCDAGNGGKDFSGILALR